MLTFLTFLMGVDKGEGAREAFAHVMLPIITSRLQISLGDVNGDNCWTASSANTLKFIMDNIRLSVTFADQNRNEIVACEKTSNIKLKVECIDFARTPGDKIWHSKHSRSYR